MCLITICPKGTLKYSDAVTTYIKNGFETNKDGSGYMYKKEGSNKVVLSKGYFNLDKMMEALKEEDLQVNDELAIHHRTGTSGESNDVNTHPFVVSDRHNEVIATDYTTSKRPVLMHNGTFRAITFYQNLDKDYSDTYAFVRHVMSSVHIQNLLDTDEKLFTTVLNEILNNSRVVLFYPDKDMKKIGNFIEDEGYFHSNVGYKRNDYYDRGGRSYSKAWEHDRGFSLNTPLNDSFGDKLKEMLHYNKNKLLSESKKHEENKYRLILLDQNSIKLDQSNFNHFYFFNKEQYIRYKATGSQTPYPKHGYLNSFDPTAETNIMAFGIGVGAVVVYDAISVDAIINQYYYVPKKEFRNLYSDYEILVSTPLEPGKQTIKKLQAMLNNNHHKGSDFEIYYKRFDRKFTKGALELFTNHVTRKFMQIKKLQLITM